MSERRRILIVEDSADDTELNLHALHSGGLDVEWRRVETEPDYLAALNWPPELIISDFSMPRFGAIRALQLLRERGTDIPFIVVSGTVGEDTAVALMKAGAQDYVIKSSLTRLAPAVVRELREARIRTAERQAVTALQESEARYRRIVETADEGVWMLDADNNTSFVNSRMAEMLGYAVEDIIGRPVYEFLDAGDRPAVDRYLERLHHGLREQHDFRLRRADGGYLWVLVSVKLVFGPGHAYAGALAMVTDITQRKLAEDAVSSQERLLHHVLDTLPVGVWITDEQGILRSCNPAGERIWAGKRLIGIEQYGEYRGWWLATGQPIAPQDWAAARAIRNGETSINEEVEIQCFDGSRRIIHNSAAPIRDDRGRILGAVIVNEDITEHKRAEQALREREALLQAIVDAEPECVKLLDADGCVLQMNAAGIAMFEADGPAQIIGRRAADVVLPEYRERFQALTREVLRGGNGILEFEIVGFKGTRRWLETHAVPLRGAQGTMLLGVTRDITERKRAEQRLTYLANYDPLTGLANRTLAVDRLQRAIIDAEKRARLVSVASLDIIRFNTINDTLGHETGNILLRMVAERLSAATRRGDTVARPGSDEFMVLLTDLSRLDDVARVVEKILTAFEQPFVIDNNRLYLNINMGISVYPSDDPGIDGLMRAAEIARHRAKERGDGQYQFYTREMTLHAESSMKLEHALRQAIERNELRLHYQPVVAASSAEAIGFEALLRWQHPEFGMVSPADFIPLAEETGLIVPIGSWVLREACRQAQAWQHGRDLPFSMAVNISARQLLHTDLMANVEQALADSGLAPQALTLEITESTLMRATAQARDMLIAFRALGISLALDDFGTGYSSFAYLKQLPIDTVKVDKTFVDDIPGNGESEAIVKAMIEMAHTLGKRVIAEGVETEVQLEFLRRLGVDEIQGFLYSTPLDSDRAREWLDNQTQRAGSIGPAR